MGAAGAPTILEGARCEIGPVGVDGDGVIDGNFMAAVVDVVQDAVGLYPVAAVGACKRMQVTLLALPAPLRSHAWARKVFGGREIV